MPRFPFGLYLVFSYIKSRLQSDSIPIQVDAIEDMVPSYSASGSIDHFGRASYNSTSWYFRVVFPLVRGSKEWERTPLSGKRVARQELEEEYPGLSASVS